MQTPSHWLAEKPQPNYKGRLIHLTMPRAVSYAAKQHNALPNHVVTLRSVQVKCIKLANSFNWKVIGHTNITTSKYNYTQLTNNSSLPFKNPSRMPGHNKPKLHSSVFESCSALSDSRSCASSTQNRQMTVHRRTPVNGSRNSLFSYGPFTL